MISEIRIKNFQSHYNSVLKLHQGVNVILGGTDSGKSAIIRALRWIIWNKPGGDLFRSTWGGDTRVGILTDSHKIIRNKGDKNNYILIDSEDKKEFNAIGANVPDEVQQALNLDSVNTQYQLDAPFLLSKTPGQIAIYFNKIAGIDVITKSTKKVEKEIRDVTKTISIRRGDLKEKKVQLKQYENIEEVEKKVVRLENLEFRYETLVDNLHDIYSVIDSLNIIEFKIKKYSKLLKAEKPVNLLLEKINEKFNLTIQIAKLLKLKGFITNIKKQINENLELISIEQPVNNIIQKINEKARCGLVLQQMKVVVNKCTTISRKWEISRQESITAENLFKQNFPNICPLCGTKIK
jgi:exonuclease SbcC